MGYLTTTELKNFKAKLLKEKEAIFNKRKDYSLHLEEAPRYADLLDCASHHLGLSYEMRLQDRDLSHLKKINLALQKLDAKNFGECEECGDFITKERLEARPTAGLCIICKEDQEFNEKSFGRSSRSKGNFSSKLSLYKA